MALRCKIHAYVITIAAHITVCAPPLATCIVVCICVVRACFGLFLISLTTCFTDTAPLPVLSDRHDGPDVRCSTRIVSVKGTVGSRAPRRYTPGVDTLRSIDIEFHLQVALLCLGGKPSSLIALNAALFVTYKHPTFENNPHVAFTCERDPSCRF
ncbi:hypothetical protein BDN70DRAFT_379667 [Pholiota conissans]|uniref:Uncharacterized protein n=1 Tax=Pholiota conissans TaxID=109636 RepID=A0A9P5ZBD8_9AGAR|nr:hypothetical protein BDN70DRAFT_379667 [Pholiota conissans]